MGRIKTKREILDARRVLLAFFGTLDEDVLQKFCKHPDDFVEAESDCYETHRTCHLCEKCWKC